ncbi:MAG: CDP-alcohol phosphatidyltransferase family protein [Deltaproteobacteria bacterium]|nr:CDP-alcohol phosphatidyltransferase family protein [Deltaproteobacteria bacterium]
MNIERHYSSRREKIFDSLCYRLLPLIPLSVTPNQVTLFGGITYCCVGPALYLAGFNRLWFLAAAAGLLIHVVGDSLDGELARRSNRASRAGMFLDYFIDSLGTSSACLGLACSGYLIPQLGMLCMLAWFLHLVTALSSSLLAGRWIFPHFSVFEMHMALIAVALAGFFAGIVRWSFLGFSFTYFDIACCIVSVFSLAEALRLAAGLFHDLSAQPNSET